MNFSNNAHLRRYLAQAGMVSLVVYESFELPAEQFESALGQVRAQHPYLDDDEAAARAAYRVIAPAQKKGQPKSRFWGLRIPGLQKPEPRVRKRLGIRFWVIVAAVVIAGLLAGLLCTKLRAEPTPQNFQAYRNALRGLSLLAAPQQPAGIILQFQQGGSPLATRPAGLVALNCSTGMSCSFSGTTFTLTSTGGGGITTLNTLTAATQLFAKADDTNITLGIGSVTDTHTFTMGWTGQLSIARGGTSAATSQGAINAISQLTTEGDLLFRNATNSTRLPRGANGDCLQSNTTTILWAACPGGGGGTAWSALTAGTNTNAGTFASSGNTWDFTAATLFKLRVGAGLTTSADGDLGYDTTAAHWKIWQNGADRYIPTTSSLGSSDGQIPIWNNTTKTFVPGDPLVQGLVAHDAAAAAINPVATGCYASAAAPSDVTADNDNTRTWCLRNGSWVVNLAAAGALIGGDATNGIDVDVTRVQGNVTVVGAAADGAAPSGNPVLIGGHDGTNVQYISTNGTGVLSTLQSVSALGDNQANVGLLGTGGSNAPLGAAGYYYDGANWDRVRGDSTDGLLVNLGANNDVTVTGTVTANAGTNLNTSALSLEATQTDVRTAVQLLDDTVFTDDTSTHATGTTKVIGIGAVASPTDAALNANDIGMPAMTTNRELLTSTAVTSIAAGDNNIGNVDVLTLPALPAGTNNIGDVDILSFPDNEPINVAQMNGVAVTMGNGASGTGVQRGTVASDNSAIANWGQGATGAAVPSGAQQIAGVGTGNLTAPLNCDSYAFYDAATNGATQVVALTSSQVIYVCGYSFSSSSATANTVKLVYGTGSNCVTGQTSMTPGVVLQAAASTGPVGKVIPVSGWSRGLKTAASNALCVLTNAAATAQVEVWYTKF